MNDIGIVQRVEEKMSVKAKICFEPQIVGAVGAAVLDRRDVPEAATDRQVSLMISS